MKPTDANKHIPVRVKPTASPHKPVWESNLRPDTNTNHLVTQPTASHKHKTAWQQNPQLPANTSQPHRQTHSLLQTYPSPKVKATSYKHKRAHESTALQKCNSAHEQNLVSYEYNVAQESSPVPHVDPNKSGVKPIASHTQINLGVKPTDLHKHKPARKSNSLHPKMLRPFLSSCGSM